MDDEDREESLSQGQQRIMIYWLEGAADESDIETVTSFRWQIDFISGPLKMSWARLFPEASYLRRIYPLACDGRLIQKMLSRSQKHMSVCLF
jgi:hypothetical protein